MTDPLNPATSAAQHQALGEPGRGPRSQPASFGVGLLIGMGAVLVSLLPWIVQGMRLPLQNLWNTQTLPGDMPLTVLPLSQYQLLTLIAIQLTAGVLAGLVLHWWHPEQRTSARAGVLLGVVAAQLLGAAQSLLTLNRGLSEGRLATAYQLGLTALLGGSIVIAAVAVILLSARSQPVAALGLGMGAVLLGGWVSFAVSASVGAYGVLGSTALSVLSWVPAVLAGVALVWAGRRLPAVIGVWLVTLLLLWLLPAFFTGIQYALGQRLTVDPAELWDMFSSVFAQALQHGLGGRRVLLAALIGVVGLALRALIGRTRPATSAALPSN